MSERALGSGWGAHRPDSRNWQGPDLVLKVGPSEALCRGVESHDLVRGLEAHLGCCVESEL